MKSEQQIQEMLNSVKLKLALAAYQRDIPEGVIFRAFWEILAWVLDRPLNERSAQLMAQIEKFASKLSDQQLQTLRTVLTEIEDERNEEE